MSWRPARFRPFYGWWIVAACFVVAMYVGGAVIYGFTAVFEPIASEFGWSYTQISLAASLRGMEMGLVAPVVGLLVDRWGPRRLILAGTVIIGIGLILLSQVNGLAMFYGVFGLLAIGTSACTSTVLMTAVANWFRRRVGTATGIMASGFGASGLLVPLVVWLIEGYDWRTAMIIIGLGMLAIGIPLSLVVRHRPEKYGYMPDGDEKLVPAEARSLAADQKAEPHTTVKEALKSRAFWLIASAVMLQILVLMGVITHVMPYLSSIDIPRSTAALVATCIPILSIAGRLGFGWLGDRSDKRRVAAVAFVVMSLGLLSFAYISDVRVWLVVPFLILFGPGYGGIITMRAAMLREHFGSAKFGGIHGLVVAIMMPGSIAGAPLAGWVFDSWGSYQAIWLAFAVLMIVGAGLVLTIQGQRSEEASGGAP